MTRTSVILEPDIEAKLREAARKNGRPFLEFVNQALREGLASRSLKTNRPRYRMKSRKLGVPTIDLTKASALSAELEDAALTRRMKARS